MRDAKSRSTRLELFVAEANAPARAFYVAEGFAEAARTDGTRNDEHLPEIHMIWQLETQPAPTPRSTPE